MFRRRRKSVRCAAIGGYMRLIPPIPLKDRYYVHIRAEVQKIFNELIYKRLNATITEFFPKVEIRNRAGSPLYDAMLAGTVWYDDGEFHGDFNARIGRAMREIGARYNSRSKTYSLALADLPDELRLANADAGIRYENLRKSLIMTLDSIDIASVNNISDIPDKYVQTIEWMNDDFVKAVKSISIPPKLTSAQTGIMASEWGQNLDKYIRDWSAENIIKLRSEIQSNAFGGHRPEALVKYIQHNYGVSQRKAEFLARQETSLLMSKFHEVRYKDIGIQKYKWSTSHDARVRKDHAELNGKVFAFDSPPVVDERTGRRANPGGDFGCRCVAIPIVE